jgi:hypothetical protein
MSLWIFNLNYYLFENHRQFKFYWNRNRANLIGFIQFRVGKKSILGNTRLNYNLSILHHPYTLRILWPEYYVNHYGTTCPQNYISILNCTHTCCYIVIDFDGFVEYRPMFSLIIITLVKMEGSRSNSFKVEFQRAWSVIDGWKLLYSAVWIKFFLSNNPV